MRVRARASKTVLGILSVTIIFIIFVILTIITSSPSSSPDRLSVQGLGLGFGV